MAVIVEDGYLIERFSRSGRVLRRAKILPQKPDGTLYNLPITTKDGRRYKTGWLYPPGVRQGRAVAWPAD